MHAVRTLHSWIGQCGLGLIRWIIAISGPGWADVCRRIFGTRIANGSPNFRRCCAVDGSQLRNNPG